MTGLIALAIQVGVGALLAYWVSQVTPLNFWVVAVVVVGGYFLLTKGKGLLHAHTTEGGGSYSGSGHLFEGMSSMAVSIIVWLGVMVIGTTVIVVPNIAAFAELVTQGWRPQLWGSFTLQFLMWVSLAFLAAGIASPNKGQQKRKIFFGLSFIVLFMITHGPQTTMAVTPTPIAPLTGTLGGDIDQSVAESGVLPVVGTAAYRFAFGQTIERTATRILSEEAIVSRGISRLWRLAFGAPAPRTPRTATSSVAAAPLAPPWSMRTVSIPATGITLPLCQGWSSSPIGGAINIATPSGQILRDEPGVIFNAGLQPDGNYTFSADPIGEARQVRIHNCW